MAEPLDIPAWIALFIGLYALAAGVGELRAPGGWRALMSELRRGHTLRFLVGFVYLFGGAAIYLVSPWRPDDWLAVVITVIGGLMVAEGLAMLAAGDRFVAFARVLIERTGKAFAGLSVLIGFALLVAALARL